MIYIVMINVILHNSKDVLVYITYWNSDYSKPHNVMDEG